MAYQVPKKDHPWRQYQNKEFKKKDKKRISKPLKIFIKEISENWDNVSVVTVAYGKEGRFTLGELSQSKQASWLMGLIRRNYGQT